MATTAADPDEVIPPIKLVAAVIDRFDPPSSNPVTAAPPVMLLIVLEETVDPEPLISTVIAVIAPVGVVFDVILSKVLLVIVLVGPLDVEAPSLLFQPSTIVLPL